MDQLTREKSAREEGIKPCIQGGIIPRCMVFDLYIRNLN
jgi:hypothetical protein